MAIPLRHADRANIAAATRTFFVTSSIAKKRQLLQSDRSARLLIDVLYHYRCQRKYLLHAFVIMPDHFHLLMTVDQHSSIERAVQFVKGGFAFRAGKELGFKSPVWERGFSEARAHDAESFARFQEYIAQNPVKRRFVEKPSEYPYSSSHAGFDLDPAPQGLKPLNKLHIVGTPEGVP